MLPELELVKFMLGQITKDNPRMVFDWVKAAQIISERKPDTASAGLCGDWEHTSGEIWRDGAPVPEEETYIFLSSTWAVPELEIDGEFITCCAMQHETGWGEHSYWPGEALKIVSPK